MPCNTITTFGVQLSVASLDLLESGLSAMGEIHYRRGETVYFGRNESFNKATGELRVTSQDRASELKRAYSAEIVKSQARKFGWTLKAIGKYQFEVMKR